jgi:serine/threonine protein kinase
MTNCPDQTNLERFLDGTCSPPEAADIQTHIDACDRCSAWIDDARQDDEILPQLRRIAADGDNKDDTERSYGLPKRIGRYDIKRVISSGGMGTVFEAEQDDPRRTVALKVIKGGLSSPTALARFHRETQVLGKLRHRGIAHIYEAGLHKSDDGELPYYAMEYIPDASHITNFANDAQLPIRRRIELFLDVCDAVQHGHNNGVIHRDLKPANILVDPQGQVKIIDFGIARATDSDLAIATMQTDVGQLIGTLQYMSPEQCLADPSQISVLCDVYALGVVFFELLSEHKPYDVTGFAVHEAIRKIREDSPANLVTLNPHIPADIDTITAKALSKERERRYASVQEMADDIRRFLNNKPILARPPSITYRLRVFTKRHKVIVCAAAIVYFVMAVALVVTISSWRNERQAMRNERQAMVEEYVSEGIRLSESGDSQAAIDAYRKALSIEADEFRALANLAILKKDLFIAEPAGRENTELIEQALELAERALSINPESAGVWNVKAVALMLMGRWDESADACRHALKTDPEYAWAESVLARILAIQGKLDHALARAEHARDVVDQKYGPRPYAVGQWYTLATIQLFMEEPDALVSLLRAIECKADETGPRLILARLRLQPGPNYDPRDALMNAQNAIQFAPKPSPNDARRPDPRAKRLLALAYLRIDDLEAAHRHADAAIQLSDLETINRFIMAIAAARAIETQAAEEQLELALRSWPTELKESGQWIASAYRGVLWFETADELIALHNEAVQSIAQSTINNSP